MDDPTGLKSMAGNGMYRGAPDPERGPPFFLPLDARRDCDIRAAQRLRYFRFL